MPRVLSFGYIEELLERRHKALTAAGIDVQSVTSKEQACRLMEAQHFDLLIIGPGIPGSDRNDLARKARVLHKAKTIFLYRWNISRAELADAVLSVDGDPQSLVNAVLQMLGNGNGGAEPDVKIG